MAVQLPTRIRRSEVVELSRNFHTNRLHSGNHNACDNTMPTMASKPRAESHDISRPMNTTPNTRPDHVAIRAVGAVSTATNSTGTPTSTNQLKLYGGKAAQVASAATRARRSDFIPVDCMRSAR